MATKRKDVLLSGEFRLYPKRKDIYTVTITRVGIWYHPKLGDGNCLDSKSVQFSDIIGCRCQKTHDSTSAFITIFSYPFKKKVFSSKHIRRRTVVIFEVNSSEDFKFNLRIAESWRNIINCLSRNLPLDKEDIYSSVPSAPGKLLVLINPFSGQGKALQIFQNEVHPMLTEAEIPFTMQVTEHAGHANEIIQNMVLSKWYGIVIVSGDGLIYEVINGLMERPDWEKAIRFPVGCLPGGSGNALCCSINYSAGEPIDENMVLHSTFILIKHKVIPMDLVLVQTPSSRIFSFLSVTWGILADIDYESERYRAIGEARFTVGALVRIMNLRKYKGRLSFLPVAEYKPKVKDTNNGNGSVVSKIRRFSWMNSSGTLDLANEEAVSCRSQDLNIGTFRKTFSEQNITHSTDEECVERIHGNGLSQNPTEESSVHLSPSKSEPDLSQSKNKLSQRTGKDFDSVVALENGMDLEDFKSDVSSQKEGDRRTQSLSAEQNRGMNGSGSDSLVWRREKITAASSEGDFEIETETALSSKSERGSVNCPLLPPLDQPVPDNWVTIEDSFIFASAQYQTHLGSDMLTAPHAHLSDGFMYVVFAREGLSKSAIVSLFLAFADGSYIDSPYVEIVKALAFRLEPLTKDGNIMVDGEKVEYGSIQGQVLPKLSRIMAMQ